MCTNDMQVLEQWCTQNTFPRLKYIQEMFEKVELINNEDWSLLIKEKSQTSRWGFVRWS